MPVTFLRTPADYFGIQEAPAQPLFQQTRALAEPAVQNQLNFMDKVTQLRQQRPLARAQAMQNEYDTIFANADRLRMQQEAAKQAEQAVSALAGLTPEADDYITQRQQIQQQFPSAMLDPRVQRIVDDNDRVFGARQSSLARQQQELQQRRAKLFGAGATPQQVEAAYQNPDAAAQLEYQLGRKPEQDQSIAMRKEEIDMLSRRLNQLTKDDMAEIPTGKDANGNPIYGPNPEYVNLAKELKDREDELRSIYRGVYAPETVKRQTTTANVGAAAADTPPPPPPPISPPPKADVEAAIRARLANVPVDELPKAIENERAKLGEAEQISKAWQGAKDDLESKLKKLLPDKDVGFGVNPLEQFAMQVIGNKEKVIGGPTPSMLVGGVGSAPMPQKQLVQDSVLKQLGLNKNQKVFREPGEKRTSLFGMWDNQDVTYDELIRDWADKFLKQRKIIPSNVSEGIGIPQEEVESAANFLKKKTLMPQ